MTADMEKERERLSQAEFLEWISRDFQTTDLLTVYWRINTPERDIGVYCALIPSAKTEKVLAQPTWDLRLGSGVPGAVEYYEHGEKRVVQYLRYGDDSGIEPLVIWRSFYGMRDSYVEISEEFRLFHQLYYDRSEDRYIKIDDAGNETEVIVVQSDRVRIRVKEIKQFLAIREMHLALYFDSREHSRLTLEELGIREGSQAIRGGLMTYDLSYGDFDGIVEWKAFSRVLGKRLLPPFPKAKSGFWGFAKEEPKKCVDFIIGVDEHGDEVLNTSDQDRLSNYFGANPGEPHYLTPVFFRKTVLGKYYQQPEKYSVEDSYLRCGGLWGMTMDNHHEDYVVAWLGDLGRDLPYEEQLHWRSFNVASCGTVSETFFKRQICAMWARTDQPDLELKYRFPSLCKKCNEKLGWSLFLPLSREDEHYFNSLRIPASDEQKEFDDLVLGLTKILVDSLDEKRLIQYVPVDERTGLTGSLSRLERALHAQGAQGYEEHIQFLRNLQELRSSGSAHRKGSKYQQVARRFAADTERLSKVFRAILIRALSLIEYLDDAVSAGVFEEAVAER